jgi:hypothetical protein
MDTEAVRAHDPTTTASRAKERNIVLSSTY